MTPETGVMICGTGSEALRGEEWDILHSRYLLTVARRDGRAQGLCDLADMGRYPLSGGSLRRFRRLDRLVRAMHRRLYSHPLRAESPPLGGIDG